MKKTLVSALTTALVVGAASTTFAAANPFEDVPADHWAYDAVAQLAKDGVVEGYGDGTYVGDAAITRYEMAQMVAKAMAKSDLKHADKAMVDKLAAEFADELNNLGVRVAKLEKKVDNVKWNGELRYRYHFKNTDTKARATKNEYLLRLNIATEINDKWTGKARFDYQGSNGMDTAQNIKSVTVDRLWAEGKYGNTVIQLGKFPEMTQYDYGMFNGERVAGGKVTFGKDIKAAVTIGRFSFENNAVGALPAVDQTGSYQGIEVYNNRAQKFTWGVGYHHIKLGALKGLIGNNDNWSVWGLGLGYKFDKNVQAKAAFNKNTSGDVKSAMKNAWFIEVDYKGAKKDVKGSWGAYLAYRHVGGYSTLRSTWELDNSAWNDDFKGLDIGVNYTFVKNIQGWIKYNVGKTVSTDLKQNALFTQIDFWF